MQTARQANLTERNWAVLGFLRFVLAVSVAICHATPAIGYTIWWTYFGGFGPVCGFFMISGFSIAASLSRKTKDYYVRRIARIYPLSITAVILTVIVIAAISPTPTITNVPVTMPGITGIITTLFLLNGIIIATPFFLLPLWSLNCEMIYYAFAPLLQKCNTKIITGLALGSALIFIAMLATNRFFDFSNARYGISSICLFWMWLLGFLAWRHPANIWLVAIGLSAAEFLIGFEVARDGVMSAILFFTTGLTVCFIPYLALPRSCVRVANYLGELSYPIYVLHVPVILFSGWLLAGESRLWAGVFAGAATLLTSIAAYHGIDRQFRKPHRVRAE